MMQEFAQQIEDTARAVVDEIHTALPGIIVSFDFAKGTATVQPQGKYLTSDGKRLNYPRISDVPVQFPFCQSAGIGVTFPIAKGDGCIIIVSEVELDEWRAGAESEGSLRFDLTSAICIPGLMKSGVETMLKACRNNAVIVGGSNSYVMVSDSEVYAASGGTNMAISKAGVVIGGNLYVNGNIY